MKAIVVYESLWGNTAAVARAIAEGIGSEARALTTDEATPDELAGADLIVVGSPLLGFSLPTEKMRADIGRNPGPGAPAPDLAHPSIRSWLDTLSQGSGLSAAFETRIWWSPGSAAKTILEKLEAGGYSRADQPKKFIVSGRFGPLKDGELDKARQWGVSLAGKP